MVSLPCLYERVDGEESKGIEIRKSLRYRFLNAIREKAFRNPAEPDGFLAGAKKPQVRMSNFWGNSISYTILFLPMITV